ncbi:MAG: glycosyl hydrolase family 18 protein [Syntrophomonas sp.]
MKRKYFVLISAAMLLVLILSCSAFAYLNSNIGIRINGQSRYFQPPAEILNNRTMVPIRFIIEDESLKGQVTWVNEMRKVIISCREKEIEFIIGSREAKVNGKTYYLDTAPYVHNNRTFVPLRFIAEQLGAVVGWNNWNREVTIDFNQPANRVFAYYYRNSSEFKENADLFTDVAFRWFQTNGSGDLFYEYQDNYDEMLAFAKSKGIKCHASVVLMDKTALHELLSSPQNRANLVTNLVKKVNNSGYDGVNIDFEFIPSDDKGLFNTFLSELKTGLGPNKTLSAAVFARTSSDKWATGYDYQQIGEISDFVVVMAYDYHYKTSAPGPVAPLWWVKNVVAYMTDIMPPNKILLGVPTYGYDWASGLTTATVTLNKLNTIRQNYQVTEHFDTESASPYYTYTDNNGVWHQIWLENEVSLAAKMKVATDNHLAGISFWRIGNGFTDLYDLLEKTQNK